MVAVADASTDSADSDTVDHLASVAVIPVLVHKLLLCYCVCTQLVVQRFIILSQRRQRTYVIMIPERDQTDMCDGVR